MHVAPTGTPDTAADHTEWRAIEEGFLLLQKDLIKLQVRCIFWQFNLTVLIIIQQFIEINAIGFRKILKKWDKRSTSTTKELYLARQVDVQPVFDRKASVLIDTPFHLNDRHCS
jgi:CDK inhibitor PHO81